MSFLTALTTGLNIGASALGIGMGVKGLIDSSKSPEKEKETPYDPNLGTLKGKTSGSAGEVEDGAYGGQMTHLGAEPSQGSLGRPVALEDDPVLNQPVDNYNNFIF